jgi:hypothetical protein
MTLDFILLADAASHALDQKLTIAGEFNTLFAERVPTVCPLMVLVARYRVTREEATQPYTIAFELKGPAGQVLHHRDHNSVAFIASDPTAPIRADAIIRLVGIVYPEYGDYRWEVLLNGAVAGHTMLHVRPVSAALALPVGG